MEIDVLASELLAWAAITEYRRPSGLSSNNLFSRGSGGWKSKMRVSVGLVSLEPLRDEPAGCLLPVSSAVFPPGTALVSLSPSVPIPSTRHWVRAYPKASL